MRRVLVIADLHHSSPRIPRLSKYLRCHDWEATVLTPPINRPTDRFGGPPADVRDMCTLAETEGFTARDVVQSPSGGLPRRTYDGWWWWPARLVVRSIRWCWRWGSWRVLQWIWYPDKEKAWRPVATAEAARLVRERGFDVVLSSSSPVTCHLVASDVSRAFGLPWIAELRDPWTQNHNYPHGLSRRIVEAALERRTLQGATHLVTVSPTWVPLLRRIHRRVPVVAIENGFDPEAYIGESTLPERFTLTYTGRVYGGKQDPTIAIRAVRSLIDQRSVTEHDIELRFFGSVNSAVRRATERLGLEGVVRQLGPVTPEQARDKQRESHALLLLNWEDPRQRGVYPLKVFEYIGALRPIVATGGHGGDAVESLLRSVGCGWYCTTVMQTADALEALYREYRSTGSVELQVNTEARDSYGFDALAKRYVQVLNGCRRGAAERDASRGRRP